MKTHSKNKTKTGLPPGSLVFTGITREHQVQSELIKYSTDSYIEENYDSIDLLNISDTLNEIHWININGVHNTEIIREIGEKFNIHKLVLEDVLNTHQRPKVDFYNEHIFVVLKMLVYDKNKKSIDGEQVSIIVGKNYLISFQ
ncbi:MAG: hypothetical protein C0596_03225 [Marinilabiliales bacterium]|nr:MAG: hypothetical protein C0596_03225 [Marinilabiliales bacterium]